MGNLKLRRGMQAEMLISIIAVAVILLLAFTTFFKLYDAFIGGDTVADSAEILGQTITALVQENTEYSQKTHILQLDDGVLLGFDPGETQITTLDNKLLAELPTQYQERCKDRACICIKNDDTTCFVVAGPNVRLGSDYTDYAATLAEKDWTITRSTTPGDARSIQISTSAPAGTQTQASSSKYQELALSTQLLVRGPAYIGDSGTVSKSVVPIIVEKIVSSGTIYIIVHPDSRRARARGFSFWKCPSDAPAACAGKTGQASALSLANEKQYCAPKSTFSGYGEDTCVLASLPTCVEGAEIRSPCNCGGAPVAFGVCMAGKGRYFPLDCSIISACTQYCTAGASTEKRQYSPLDYQALTDEVNRMTTCANDDEKTACELNPCALSTPCTLQGKEITACRG